MEYKLSALDQKILTVLSINARFSLSLIAKILRTRIDIVRYHLLQMENKGIIARYGTKFNYENVGLHTSLAFVKLHTLKDIDTLLDQLQKCPFIRIIQLIAGAWDLRISFVSKDLSSFHTHYNSMKSIMGNAAQTLSIMHAPHDQFTRNCTFDSKTSIDETLRINKSAFYDLRPLKNDYAIDQIDRQIMQILYNNARISIKELSQTLQIATTSIHARIKKLVASNKIQCFFPQIDFTLLGYQSYKVLFNTDPNKEQALRSYLQKLPQVIFITELVGPMNFEVTLYTPTQYALYELILSMRKKFAQDAISVQNIVVFQTVKNEFLLP